MWCCTGDTAGLAQPLDRWRVRWRPGLERTALQKGLAFATRHGAC